MIKLHSMAVYFVFFYSCMTANVPSTTSTTKSSPTAQTKSISTWECDLFGWLSSSFCPEPTPAPATTGYAPTCGTFNCEQCGVTYAAVETKIVGGTVANPHSWPAQIYLQFSYSNYMYPLYNSTKSILVEGVFACGGTLINPDTVMTAAHCIITSLEATDPDNSTKKYTFSIPTDPSFYTVFLGYQNLSDLSSGVQMSVKSVRQHPYYDGNVILNDIALIKLTSKVSLTDSIQIACLPNVLSTGSYGYPDQYEHSYVYAAGWGATVTGGQVVRILNNVQLELYNSSECGQIGGINFRWDEQVCAGGPLSANGNSLTTQNICQGDSGGGLYHMDSVDGAKKYVASGIVSYTFGSCNNPPLAMYTKVSAYLDWINQTVFQQL